MRAVSLLFHDVYLNEPRESGFSSRAADRYKLRLSDFDKQLQSMAVSRLDAPVLATELMDFSCWCSAQAVARRLKPARYMFALRGLTASAKATAVRRSFTRRRKATRYGNMKNGLPFLITVDDGGVSYYSIVAERLEALGWRAHCFVTTGYIGRTGFLTRHHIRELDRRGHLIGSHSVSHPPRFSALTVNEMMHEWTDSRRALEDILGHEVVTASVPGGYHSRRVAQAARDAGLRVLFTSEPTTTTHDDGRLIVMGRFTMRPGHAPDTASRLVVGASWSRLGAWASWNAKGLVKPLLGPTYGRMADWLLSGHGMRSGAQVQ